MVKIIIISLIACILIIYLKSVNQEMALIAILATSILLISFTIGYLPKVFSFINEVISLTKIDKEYFIIIFKITAIGYLIEFVGGVIEDFGLKSLSDKLYLFGKVIIITLSLPILYAIFNVLKGLIV